MSCTRNLRSYAYSYKRKAPYYDACVESFDSASQEDAESVMAFLQNLYEKHASTSESEHSEEASSAEADDSPDAVLQQRLAALSSQFPAFRTHMRAAAYQAGIYQPKDSCGYHPEINRFIRTMDTVSEDKLPAAIARFIQELNEYSVRAEERTQCASRSAHLDH